MSDPSNSDADDEELQTFIHRWAEAIVANDTTRMEQFVTDDWMLVDKPGLIPRDAFHGVVASGQLRHDEMSHEVLHLKKITDDVAILVTQAHNSGSFDGQPMSADEWTSDVLLRTPDGWKCVLTQLTPRAG